MPAVGDIALDGQVPTGSSVPKPFSEGRPEVVHVGSLDEFSPAAQEAFADNVRYLGSPVVCYAEIDPSGRLLVMDVESNIAEVDTRWETEGWKLDKSGFSGSPHITAKVLSETEHHICAYFGMEAEKAWLMAAERECKGVAANELRRQFGPTVRFDSDSEGDLLVFGAGSITAVREGDGDGDAVRSDDGWGHAIRLGGGRGDAMRTGAGHGRAHRDGDGDGNALRTGHGAGDAVRDGGGNGWSSNSCSGAGHARREGSGDGDAIRSGSGSGSASRDGDGDGNAFRAGAGMGDATKFGRGDGFAERRGSGDGDALAGRLFARRLGEGNGLSKVIYDPRGEGTQHQHSDRVVEVSVLDPATNEYRLVARYDGREPTSDELEQHAEDHYPDRLPDNHSDVVRTEKAVPAAWTQRT